MAAAACSRSSSPRAACRSTSSSTTSSCSDTADTLETNSLITRETKSLCVSES
eukprot:CAMPEP_0175949930 /NCGR_PEP_ID=MMETSP0108-20121206/29316_1 /TAXON_ID=195067 ORGANISM="Goniomonas pacifica, Strain CCMP1869" /NCGR_SAMPLE_ID=MMETSP0108 /ASSEMBLY_ACC=CAM_ASM_000204 /LENGTH=52 /DNA_ID=CAMNT_0017275929 /DNA_START=460 /DNA_END=618 /DNA_ORIENTATION=-